MYLDIARELKKLWNIKLTIIPIVIGALCAVIKGLVQGLEDLKITGRVETVKTTALRWTEKSPGDLRRLAVTQTPYQPCQSILYI